MAQEGTSSTLSLEYVEMIRSIENDYPSIRHWRRARLVSILYGLTLIIKYPADTMESVAGNELYTNSLAALRFFVGFADSDAILARLLAAVEKEEPRYSPPTLTR